MKSISLIRSPSAALALALPLSLVGAPTGTPLRSNQAAS